MTVEPAPTSWSERTDFYGNPVASFAVDGPFNELTVTSTSSVSVSKPGDVPDSRATWDEVRDLLAIDLGAASLAAREFSFESPLVELAPNVRQYAEPSFPAGRPLVDAVSSSPKGSSSTSSTIRASPR